MKKRLILVSLISVMSLIFHAIPVFATTTINETSSVGVTTTSGNTIYDSPTVQSTDGTPLNAIYFKFTTTSTTPYVYLICYDQSGALLGGGDDFIPNTSGSWSQIVTLTSGPNGYLLPPNTYSAKLEITTLPNESVSCAWFMEIDSSTEHISYPNYTN